MTKPYTPRPGSLAQKVIDYLQTGEGAQISTATMVTSFKVKPSSTSNLLKAPRKFGVLVLHKNGKQALYTLPGVEPVWDDATEADAPTTAPKARKVKAPKKKAAPPQGTRKKRQAVAAPAELERPAAIASLWDDGDVVLAGITINNDAASVTLSDLQARQVHRFLERVYGPTV